MNTLNLTSIPDNGLYRLEEEYFCDANGRLWKNAGRKGDRPLQLYHCEPSGEASGPIWADIEQVIVDGIETPFRRFNRQTWDWERN